MANYHLKPQFNGITDEQLMAIREIAIGRSVSRDEHNFWFDTNATLEEVEAVCSATGLEIV